jgi:hypothetical protein
LGLCEDETMKHKWEILLNRLPMLGMVTGLAGIALFSACSSADVPGERVGQKAQSLNAPPVSKQERALDAVGLAGELVKDVPELKQRFDKAPTIVWRTHGETLVPQRKAEGKALTMHVERAPKLTTSLVFSPLENPEQRLEMTPIQANDIKGQVTDQGRIVFADAFPSTDVIQTLDHEGIHETMVIHDDKSPSLFVWKVNFPGEKLEPQSLDKNRGVLVDKLGHVRILVSEAQVVDAKGTKLTVPISFAMEGFASLRIDPTKVSFPVAVDYSFKAPPLGTLAAPPVNINGRVMVLLDTSGSMMWGFSNSNSTMGDSDSTAVFCDNAIGTSFACNQNVACTTGNGGLNAWPVQNVNQPGRLFASKAALQNVLNAHAGLIDFGLERFIEDSSCANAAYCCTPQTNGTTAGRCKDNSAYTNITGYNTTYWGGCGSSTNGGRVLVTPGPSSSFSVYPWVDYVEDFCSSTGSVGGPPRNPEIRAEYSTPLARAVRTARTGWFEPIHTVSKTSPNPGSPLYDPQIDCRSYALVVMTDGADSCGGDPSTEVQSLTNVNSANPVKTYVLGMGAGSGLDIPELNQMATSGGTTSPTFANSQDEIEAMFANIVASTVKFETCNGVDDNCNQIIDEGLGVYQECTQNSECGSNSCNAGRCACTNNNQCSSGNSCAAGFCRPACSVGVGACLVNGVRKCGAGAGQCCTNNASATCTPLAAGTPGTETCNGIDDDCNGIIDDVPGGCQGCTPLPEVCDGKDNDCDGIADNNLTDTGKTCGLNLGICTPGTTVCTNGMLGCSGGVQPGTEVCNGLDDNCDGVVDGMTQPCYAGPSGTNNVGICHEGSQTCNATVGSGTPSWSTCVGQVVPATETCNGLDDNCNGIVDDVAGLGNSCCPSGNCGTGQCQAGTNQCSGGSVQCIGAIGPTVEVCDGIDNNCNGIIDDVAGVGSSCCPSGNCGTGICKAGALSCSGGNLVCTGAIGPSAELCDNLDNDCNGQVDDLPGVGSPCCPPGVTCSVGECKKGVSQCNPGNGQVECVNFVGPASEVCDGKDNNCNGLLDDVPGAGDTCCSSGKCGVGICKAGTKACQGSMLACIGEVLPKAEICDGVDNDCNGQVDDVGDIGQNCCPFKNAQGVDLCGVGICASGTKQCITGSAQTQCVGAIGPQPEICDGIDNDCNGLIDDLPGGTVGGPCCPSGKCGVGVCQAGTLMCGPNGLTCSGAVNPTGEVCDNLDNDCNGKVDDVPGIGTSCCPSGKCGQGICQPGVFNCGPNGPECTGGVGPETEICDGIDNDCNGIIDDVTGVGTACCPEGSPAGPAPEACNKGICSPGILACEGTELKCQGGTPPDKEICDGIDNDCDGEVDESQEVAENDPTIGVVCDPPQAPNDQAPCQPGVTICQGAKAVCDGAVGPGPEQCDGVDNNCDGIVDEGDLCDSPKVCNQGTCVSPCSTGEFPCPGGQQCLNGFCIPNSQGTGGAAGASGNGNAGNAGMSAGGSSTTQGGTGGTAGTSGTAGNGQTGGSSTAQGGNTSSTGGNSTAGYGTGNGSGTDADGGVVKHEPIFEEQGGCGCTTVGSRSSFPQGAYLFALLGAFILVRRQREEGAQ